MSGETIDNQVGRDEVESLLATRRELGPEYEAALVDSFAERVERAVAARAEADLATSRGQSRASKSSRIRQFVLGIVSLAVGVPVTIVPVATVGSEGLVAVLAGWCGIAAVNGAHALAVRRDVRPGR